ncbi:hypothetical protein [Actibacterium sp. 188UL27-1]|uniref:hypothetical protein n=1 Tax=Actibacterium sp. 188UL27-1 TaxID=2786961 RepID=UPI00195CD287|nr:hypothetical protein [Actibacterium sp. 188UL27-1]MBM7067523.1 hypothetical protein [Actibacterium sp. 188UL27-1]
MSVLENLANDLAINAIAAERDSDDTIVDDVSKSIGDMSPTLQEAYQTMVRLHRAAARGQALVAEHMAKHGLRPAPARSFHPTPLPPQPMAPQPIDETAILLAAAAEVEEDDEADIAPMPEPDPEQAMDAPSDAKPNDTEPAAEEETAFDPDAQSKDPVRALMQARRLAAEAEEAEKRAEKAKAEARALRGDHLSMIDALIEGSDDD